MSSQCSSGSGSTVVLDSPSTVLHPHPSTAGSTEVDTLQPRNTILAHPLIASTVASRPLRPPFHPFLGNLDFRPRASNLGMPVTVTEVNISCGPSSQGGTDTDVSSTNKLRFDEGRHKPKYYYKFWPIPCKYIKVRFDRLALLAVLDR